MKELTSNDFSSGRANSIYSGLTAKTQSTFCIIIKENKEEDWVIYTLIYNIWVCFWILKSRNRNLNWVLERATMIGFGLHTTLPESMQRLSIPKLSTFLFSSSSKLKIVSFIRILEKESNFIFSIYNLTQKTSQ